jgi:hypothetical protein
MNMIWMGGWLDHVIRGIQVGMQEVADDFALNYYREAIRCLG